MQYSSRDWMTGIYKEAMDKRALRLPSNEQVIPVLNDLLRRELAAINQYMVQHAMCANWGYNVLAGALKGDAMGEMKHAESLIERIIFLEGTPTVGELEAVHVGTTIPEMLQNNLKAELDAVQRYNKAVELCDRLADNGSKKLFEDILMDEEGHFDATEAKLGQIKQMGLQLFLSEQTG